MRTGSGRAARSSGLRTPLHLDMARVDHRGLQVPVGRPGRLRGSEPSSSKCVAKQGRSVFAVCRRCMMIAQNHPAAVNEAVSPILVLWTWSSQWRNQGCCDKLTTDFNPLNDRMKKDIAAHHGP